METNKVTVIYVGLRGIWRNGLLFSPTVKYGAYSYQDIMLSPLSRALSRALRLVSSEGQLWPRQDRLRPVVYMALQGECLRGLFTEKAASPVHAQNTLTMV